MKVKLEGGGVQSNPTNPLLDQPQHGDPDLPKSMTYFKGYDSIAVIPVQAS